jgi:predicted ATPase
MDAQRVSNPSTQLSSGEAEVLTLALDLLSICNIWDVEEQAQRILLIDEPDPHLHPDLQVRLARFLFRVVDEFDVQLVIATHSTTMLAAIGQHARARMGVVYLNGAASEQKVIPFNDVFDTLATVLGGHALVAPLFGAPLLLVEGDDDYQI